MTSLLWESWRIQRDACLLSVTVASAFTWTLCGLRSQGSWQAQMFGFFSASNLPTLQCLQSSCKEYHHHPTRSLLLPCSLFYLLTCRSHLWLFCLLEMNCFISVLADLSFRCCYKYHMICLRNPKSNYERSERWERCMDWQNWRRVLGWDKSNSEQRHSACKVCGTT